ncbi:MAG TPA: DUF2442 domain-containing protein [Chromatiaceae bacterium]|nr:MAG: DUF2442 domain-containing protein [Thiohalocapsa sp. PB-PSB1]HBG96855.1 DUF2442 domain-containing protein [Chromatiaceae bacterium]HCS91381.1 DUF2442 domain-containing protein [Chromatiaceae bacterium]
MSRYHEVEQVIVLRGVLSAVVDGQALTANLRELSPLLKAAPDVHLEVFEVSPSGYGIHWPLVDEDISVDGLLGIVHQPDELRQSA